jgi:hypothetical protein
MPAFRDLDEFERVFVAFLKDLAVDDKTGAVANTGLVIVFRITDFGIDIVTDSTVEPAPGAAYLLYTTPRFDGKATVIYEMTSEIIERVYLGRLPAIMALTLGYVRAHGAHFDTIIKARRGLENAIPLYQQWHKRHHQE